MGRFETKKTSDDSLGTVVMALATGGLSLLLGDKTTYTAEVKDNATGKTYTGHGSSTSKAIKAAESKSFKK